MQKFIAWVLACAVGLGAWHIAAAGNSMSFWPKTLMFLVFWILLDIYVRLENVRR